MLGFRSTLLFKILENINGPFSSENSSKKSQVIGVNSTLDYYFLNAKKYFASNEPGSDTTKVEQKSETTVIFERNLWCWIHAESVFGRFPSLILCKLRVNQIRFLDRESNEVIPFARRSRSTEKGFVQFFAPWQLVVAYF